jgi:hypothetical protein
MKREICGDTIETGQIQYLCTRGYKHKDNHATRWKAHNLGEDPRMITVSWPQKTVANKSAKEKKE